MSSHEDLLRAARKWVAEHYPGKVVRRVSLDLDDGSRAKLPIPLPIVSEPVTDAPLTECEGDLLALLADAGRRMTTDEVLKGLQDAGKTHGDSTVVKALARMSKPGGLLSNRRDGHGRGYGLADWE